MRNTNGRGRARVLSRFAFPGLPTMLLALACQGGAPPADAGEGPTRSATEDDTGRAAEPPAASDELTDGTGMQSSPSDSLRLRVDVPDRIPHGETVPITFRVANISDRTLTLYLTGREIAFDVIVERTDGATVWRRLEGEVVRAILRLETLPPGEALVLHAVWDQRSDDGALVPPGEYRVRAELLTEGGSLVSPPEPLRIG